MLMPIAYDEHDACKSSSWGAQRININIFDPCVWRVLADCCYPEKMRRGWTLAWAPTQLLQVEIQARPVSIVSCQFSETSYCSSPGSSTTNLTSNFPNPANIDIIINTCEVKRSLYLFLWVFDNLSAINVMIINTFRLEICQKKLHDRIFGHYTLKVRKLWLFLRKEDSVNAFISVILVAFLLEFNWVCKILTVSVQNHTWCV